MDDTVISQVLQAIEQGQFYLYHTQWQPMPGIYHLLWSYVSAMLDH